MKIFISRAQSDIFELLHYCKYRLWEDPIALPLIETKSVPFTAPAHYDCIFFGSRRGVNHFLEKNQILTTAKIACAGPTTKKHLEDLGYQVAFYPSKSGDLKTAQKEFKDFVGASLTYFPATRTSRGTYHEELPKNQKVVQDTYETKELPQKIQDCDIYAFTSPSNYQAFISANSFPENAFKVAWGGTTADAMRKDKNDPEVELESSTTQALVDALNKAFPML
mgnify:CR=1 FL=1